MTTTKKTTKKRHAVSVDEAVRRIGDSAKVHTFMQAGGGMLVGADRSRHSLIDDMAAYGVENAGEAACAMGHTLVIRDYPLGGGGTTPLFIEAAPDEGEKEE